MNASLKGIHSEEVKFLSPPIVTTYMSNISILYIFPISKYLKKYEMY